VIVVNDRSPDDTLEMLASIHGVRVVSNKRNLGFVDSSRRGADLARGHLLVFLNNDTLPRGG
jgi:GT2 family glycosyltransferase